MDRNRRPGIYLLTDTGKKIDLIGVMPDGKQQSLCGLSPIMELVDFVNFDFSAYRASVERLWKEHAVFEERREVPYADYEDFARQALPLAERLAETAPAAYWDVLYHLDPATKMLYDGKPIFPSRKAFAVLNALRRPYFLQNRMRNLFEIGFADFERGTQQDHFRALEDTWPGLIDRAFSIRFLPQADGSPIGQGREYTLSDLYELLLAELSLYFQQDEQRIAGAKTAGGILCLRQKRYRYTATVKWAVCPVKKQDRTICGSSARIPMQHMQTMRGYAADWRNGPTVWSWQGRALPAACSNLTEGSMMPGWTKLTRQRRTIGQVGSPHRNS